MRQRHVRRLADIDAQAWDALFPADYPFCRHAWLARLETHGCVGGESGWEPWHLLVEDQHGALIGAAPLYRKEHSYGEFVFDFSWADASHRLGRPYYPKLINAIPYVPSAGPRIGARNVEVASLIAGYLARLPEQEHLSSMHSLFVGDFDSERLREHGLVERHDVQFQWTDRGFGDFAGFAASLQQEKRKKLMRERRRVREAGIDFEIARGADLSERDWDLVYQLYAQTYLDRGQRPYFSHSFLADAGGCAELDFRLIFAIHHSQCVGVAITLVAGNTLYGRHWGAAAQFHSLHFECCYYQGIELCLREGLTRFDAGTQGAHKHGRGFVPVQTRSFHALADPRLRHAVVDFLARERALVAAHQDELMHHTPYRSPAIPDATRAIGDG